MNPAAVRDVHSAVTVLLGSLFTGIGGMDLGIEEALRDEGFDVETRFQVEADPFCLGILAERWPHAVRYSDVRHVGAAPRPHQPPAVHVLGGGPPCQDLSLAGNRAGLGGERSGLWAEQARLVEEIRPSVVVWENVPGARVPVRERGTGRVLEQPALATVLGDIASRGYDAVWFSVSVSDVDGPQSPRADFRRRVAARPRGRLPRSTT